jgi:hypothetical protein
VKGREEDADATVLFVCLKYSRLLRSKIRQKGNFPHQAALSVGARKIIQIPHGFAQTALVVQLPMAGLGLFFQKSARALAPRGLLRSAYEIFFCA